MNEDIPRPFDLPAVARKKVSASFDRGRITSDRGVMLLAHRDRRLGIADQLAAVIPGDRDPSRVTHRLPDILRARIFAIPCGYEDGDDLDRLRASPAFTLACGRLPGRGRPVPSHVPDPRVYRGAARDLSPTAPQLSAGERPMPPR